MLVTENINADLYKPEETTRAEEIYTALASVFLEDTSSHFLQRHKTWLRDGRTWIIWRGHQLVRSQTNYLLGTERYLYQNVSEWDARHNSYHYIVLGCLRG